MRVLIAARTAEAAETLSRFLTGTSAEIRTATDGLTLRAIDLSGFDLIFLSIPPSGESGVELFAELREKTTAHLFALVKKELAPSLRKKTEGLGVYVIPKPLFKGALEQAFAFAALNLAHEAALRAEVAALTGRLAEQKQIGRAKLLLVEGGMTEEEAHRHLQQTAMNRRVTQAEAAAEIIEKNERKKRP